MKNMSKKLLCLLLVIIMVMSAVPFGAFAEEGAVPEGEETVVTEGEETVAPEGEEGAMPLDIPSYGLLVNLDGKRVASYTVEVDADVVAGYGEQEAAEFLLDAAGSEYAAQLKSGALTLEALVDNHATSGNYGVKLLTPVHTHEWKWNGLVGDASGHGMVCKDSECTATSNEAHTMVTVEAAKDATCTEDGMTEKKSCTVCGYVEGGERIPSAGTHVDANKDGVCDVCGEKGLPIPTEPKRTYKISVKMTGTSTTVATGASADFTEDDVAALNDVDNVRALLKLLGGSYAEVAKDMKDSDFAGVTTETSATTNYMYIWLKDEPADPYEGKIQVVFDSGDDYYIDRKSNLGRSYFSVLGLGNNWGTTQAYLRIYDANGSRDVHFNSISNDAKVKETDYKVEVRGVHKRVTIVFLSTPSAVAGTSTPWATRYYEAGTRLGSLPGLPAGYDCWTIDGEEITEDTIYDWQRSEIRDGQPLYARPANRNGRFSVHLYIYNKDNKLVKDVDVTDKVQGNGIISRNSLISVIEYQTGRKNLTLAGLFNEEGWAYYLNNKNSLRYEQKEILVKDGIVGTQNLYVVMTNVSGSSNADSSNPKTGDNAIPGTAAFVMAVSVIGLTTVYYMKKKELF